MPDPYAPQWARRSGGYGDSYGNDFGGGGSAFHDGGLGWQTGLDPNLQAILPSKQDVASVVAQQEAENPLGTFGDILGAVGNFVGHITGAEALKGFIVGAKKDGFEGGIARAVENYTQWKQTPFSEIRAAFGGGDISGIGAVATDLTGEILSDPLTWLTFGFSAIPKALLSKLSVVSKLGREELLSKGLWHSAAFHVPLGKWILGRDITIPLAEIPIIAPIFKGLDSVAAKALDVIGYNARRAFSPVTRAFSNQAILPRGPMLQQVTDVQKELNKTRQTIEAAFWENYSTTHPMLRDLMLKDPKYQRFTSDMIELGIEGIDDKGAILTRYENFDTFRSQAKIARKLETDSAFATRWGTLNDAQAIGTDDWLKALRETYQKDKVQLPSGWLQAGGLTPRAGVDFNTFETADEFISEANKIHREIGLPEIPTPAGGEAARRTGEQGLQAGGDSVRALKRDIRQGRIQEFMDTYADLERREKATPGLKDAFNDWLGAHREAMQGLHDSETASGIVNGFQENYLARYITPEARKLLDSRMVSRIQEFTGGDQVIMSFMKERKFSDMLTSEVNEFLKHVGTKATNYKALNTSAEEMAMLSGKYGPAQAMISKVFPEKWVRSLRKIDPGAVDFFHTNPIYSDYLRTKGSAFAQGVSKAWDAFFHEDSPTVMDSALLTDTNKVTSLIEEAQASSGAQKLVYRKPTGVSATTPEELTYSLAQTEIHNRVALYRGALGDDLATRLMDAKGGYDAVIGQMQAALKLGKDFVIYPAEHPAAVAQPVSARLLADVAGRAKTSQDTLDYLRSVRSHMLGEGIPQAAAGKAAPTLSDVTSEASGYMKRARAELPALAENRMNRVAELQQNLKTLDEQSLNLRNLVADVEEAKAGQGGFAHLAADAHLDSVPMQEEWIRGTRSVLERSLKKAQAGGLPTEQELAVELLGSDLTSHLKSYRDLRQSEVGLRGTISSHIGDLWSRRDSILQGMKDGTAGAKETLSGFLKTGINRDIVDNQAALLHQFSKDGLATFDELPEALQKSLASGRLKGEVHLVDSKSFDESRRLIGELRKPDPLRKNPFFSMIANVSDWWKPITVAHPAFLQSRVRDVTQGLYTLAQQGMVSMEGFRDAGIVTKALRDSMGEGVSLADKLAGQTIKVMSDGAWTELPLADVVQFAQRRGLLGPGAMSDQLITAGNDAAARLLKGAPGKQRNFLQKVGDVLGVTSPETSKTLQGGINFARRLDDRVRTTGFFSAIRDGMDLETAAAQTRKWTYGLDGPSTTFEKSLAGNFVPLYSFAKWSVDRTVDQLIHQPATLAWIAKGRKVAAENMIGGGPPEKTGLMDTVLPKFINENIGVPFLHGADGTVKYLTMGSLLPAGNFQSVVNAIGAIFGPNKTPLDRASPLMRYAGGQLNPVWKTTLETVFNTNLYSGRDLEAVPNEQVEMFGMPMSAAKGNVVRNFSRLADVLDKLNFIDVPRFISGLANGEVTGLGPDAVPRNLTLSGHEQTPFLQRLLTSAVGPSPVKTYDINIPEQARKVRFMQERTLMDKIAMLRNRLLQGTEPDARENAQVFSESIKYDLATIARRQELEASEPKAEPIPGRVAKKPLGLEKYYNPSGR